MKTKHFLLFSLLILTLILTPSQDALAQESNGIAVVISLEGPLTPVMHEYLKRGLKIAERDNAELMIMELNTPGGSVDLMSAMVETMRASKTPIVVYVSPRGAIAGSAGTVLTLAGHLSAMAPETAIGAASPVGPEGEDIGETLETKIKEIIKAQIRSLAGGRSLEAILLAEDTVENATALTSAEAYEVGLVDFIASDLADLLFQLDGVSIETVGGKKSLNTNFLTIKEVAPTIIEELLAILTNPNIVFLLLTIGVQAILIELGSPGGWVAGFIGVVSLALAGYGLGILPVNYFGLIFLVTAFVLFFLEIKAPVHGALAATGLVSFIAGALILFNSPGTPQIFRVSIPLVVGTGIATAATFIVILTIALRAQKAPVRTGEESLIGKIGSARSEIKRNSQGKVYLAGEFWTAELAEEEVKIKEGDRVEVVEVEGIRLIVKPRE